MNGWRLGDRTVTKIAPITGNSVTRPPRIGSQNGPQWTTATPSVVQPASALAATSTGRRGALIPLSAVAHRLGEGRGLALASEAISLLEAGEPGATLIDAFYVRPECRTATLPAREEFDTFGLARVLERLRSYIA